MPPRERIVALDVIRGFAMFGVLVAYTVWSLGNLPADAFSTLDHRLAAFTGFAVDGKFYTLLAFLFGLGFQLQLERSREDDGEAVRLFRRRLLILAGIGLAHALLLRNGDILLPYALTGLLLVPFRRVSDLWLPAAALIILIIPLPTRLLWEASGLPIPQRPAGGGAYLVENFAWVRYWYATAILHWPPILSLFLLGMLAGRRGWIVKSAERSANAVKLLAVGLAAGTACYIASGRLAAALAPAAPGLAMPAASLLFTFHAWALAATYVALLVLALNAKLGPQMLQPFAAVGRMALTNYLMQAALIVPFCLVFDLFDRFTPTRGLLLALLLFPLQAAFSLAWLRRFDFGPAEWLWRRLTYGRVPGARSPAEAEI